MIYQRVGAIEKKIDEFIPRPEAEAKIATVKALVDGIQRELNHITEAKA